METLAVKYRPRDYEAVCGQKAIITILKKQVETGKIKNSYLFQGPSGTGKTTLARLFAEDINSHQGSPIEIDAASTGSADNVRAIVEDAVERSLDSTYKVYIIDECHLLSAAAWTSFLKCLEEPPHYTIFIFCTTESQKIPFTITNRAQVFNLSRLSDTLIVERLKQICTMEGIEVDPGGLQYLSRVAEGSVRQAITLMEKCLSYSEILNVKNIQEVLGDYPLKTFFDLTNALIDSDRQGIIRLVDNVFEEGKNLNYFIECYLSFVFDLSKYCLFKGLDSTKIPPSMLEEVNYATDSGNQLEYFVNLQDKLLEIKNMIHSEASPKDTIEIMLMGVIK